MRRHYKEEAEQLFGQLIQSQFEAFAAGCRPDLVVTVRGSSPVPVALTRSDIPDWYGSLQALSPTVLTSTVEVGRFDGDSGTVLLRHAFSRHGIDYLLEMVNLVTFRDGLLAEWSSYPLDLPEYSRAWRVYDHSMLASA
jgi:ketosteroid isomerase-like protein